MLDRFGRLAVWAQRRIASPYHLVAFLIVSVIWLGWAVQVHFSTFAQLVLNTPTTWAEYLFEILVLAAALRAANSSEDVLVHLRGDTGRLLAITDRLLVIEQHVERMIEHLLPEAPTEKENSTMTLASDVLKDLEKRFDYHPNTADVVGDAHQEVRDIIKAAAASIIELTPAGREASLVLTKLEEADHWAHAAIARNQVTVTGTAPGTTEAPDGTPGASGTPGTSGTVDTASAAGTAAAGAPGTAPGTPSS